MIVFDTKEEAKNNVKSDEKIVKVDGGYAVMKFDEYRAWKNQK